MPRPFSQVDVFTTTPYSGNPVAVVLDVEGLTTRDAEVRQLDEPLRDPGPRQSREMPVSSD
jgi:hypothetical protein